MVDNLPLSLLIFKINIPPSADALTLVIAVHIQQCYNMEITKVLQITLLKIAHFAPNFPLSLSARIFHSDSQAKLQFLDTGLTWLGRYLF